MKTGLFGGTFNPVHSGHTSIAADIINTLAFDRLIIIPAALPPHKSSDHMPDIRLRLEMTRLAFKDLPKCRVSDIETRRPGCSYTIDTVFHFIKALPAPTELFFIAGLDAFLELDTWKDYMVLIESIPFIVINRPLADGSEKAALDGFLSSKISRDYVFLPETSVFIHDSLQPIFFYDRLSINLSSSQIRERLKNGLPVEGALPYAVEQFINQRGLYQ